MMRTLSTVCNDRSGGVAILFALTLVVLVLGVGLSVDTYRMHNTGTKVQAALDAATLASAKLLGAEGAPDGQVRQAARDFFDAQLESLGIGGVQLKSFQADIDRDQTQVTASVKVVVPTVFSSVGGGLIKVEFEPSSTAIYKQKKIELALVVDVTGSMGASGKIDALKVAANELVDTLFNSNPVPQAVRVALVPYSAAVNAGSYFDAVTAGGATGGSWTWSSWGGWTAGATDTCVVERAGAEAYTATPPGAGTFLGVSSGAVNLNYSCPTPTVVPLADLADGVARASFKSSISALTPGGATAGHIGAAWGWYMLQPNWSFLWPGSTPRPFADPDVMKIVILMTDGEFNTSYENGNMNSTTFTDVGSSGYQALQLCSNMKAQNITIYTIGFMTNGNAESMLKTCSGEDNFYNADSSSQLLGSFQDIVAKLTQLRIAS